jgi:hypothetical protein
MNSVSKIILVLIVLIYHHILAQTDLTDQFNYAKKLYDEENYFDAITEFKRLEFFDGKKQFVYSSNYFIALSYKAGGKFNEAMRFFVLAEMNATNSDDYYSSKILQARTNILRRTTKQAHRILDQLEIDERFINKKNEIKYWRGWSFIFEDDWLNAGKELSDVDSILASFCRMVDKEKYSVDFAKYSSYIIPGFGQFYTEEYLSGLLSLGWNVLFGYLTINAFIEDRIFDGLVIGNFLWLRFYLGNVQNAEKFAIEKNLNITNAALDFLQNKFVGEKP